MFFFVFFFFFFIYQSKVLAGYVDIFHWKLQPMKHIAHAYFTDTLTTFHLLLWGQYIVELPGLMHDNSDNDEVEKVIWVPD